MQEVIKKPQKGFRLSGEAQALLIALSQRLGVNQTAVVEMAIREKAEAAGVRSVSTEGQQVSA